MIGIYIDIISQYTIAINSMFYTDIYIYTNTIYQEKA